MPKVEKLLFIEIKGENAAEFQKGYDGCKAEVSTKIRAVSEPTPSSPAIPETEALFPAMLFLCCPKPV